MRPQSIESFLGLWTVQREINDKLSGQINSAEGTASLRVDSGQFRFHEQLELRLANHAPMRAERSYIWKPERAGIALHFEDGRYFHFLKLGEDSAKDHHDCAPDSYDVTYDFSGWPRWETVWHVHGPRKHYEMRTVFYRGARP